MEAELIQLLKFADESIGRYITFYATGMGALAVFVMTEGYKRNFKPIGKIVLSGCLLGLAYGDWSTLVYYHEIYNATVAAIQNAAVQAVYQPWLLDVVGPEGSLQPKPMWHVHSGHVLGAVIGLSLVWWQDVQTTIRQRVLARIRTWKARRRVNR